MITISLCMIVKNEEENLPRCLNTVAGVFDEVIIVDTGSTDRTVEIAKNYTAQVYPFIWTEDFSAARNFSFSKAKMEYCMWLDADDILTPEDRKALIVLTETLSKQVDCVMMKYRAGTENNCDPLRAEWEDFMITVSLCMIVKNEEGTLPQCLNTVADVFDEIIIVDTGSTDRTVEVARTYTDRVYSFVWTEDFSEARNFSFSNAKMEYCMWLDADDILTPEDREALISLKETLSKEVDCVMMKYRIGAEDNLCYYRERLLKREKNPKWRGFIHEAITPFGEIMYSDIVVTHAKTTPADPSRNLRIFEHKRTQGAVFSPREEFYYGRELYDHREYQKAARQLEYFLTLPEGWVENKIEACRVLANCCESDEQSLSWLFRSFAYDLPRAETCCDIGWRFMRKNQYECAIYWYEHALSTPRNDQSGAFVQPDCYDFIPAVQLCVCYDRLGNHTTARFYHDLSGAIRPESQIYRLNQKYFEMLAQQEKGAG